MSRRRRVLAIALPLGAAVALLALWGPCGARREARPGDGGDARRAGDAAAAGDVTAKRGRPGGRLAVQTVDERARAAQRAGLWMLADDGISVVLADYLVSARLPPHSRVLLPGMQDLLEPNRRWDSLEPTVHRDGTFPATEDLQTMFTADKFRLRGAEPLAAWLEVTRAGEGMPVRIVSARAVGVHIVTRDPVGLEATLEFTQGAGARQVTTLSTAGTPLAGHAGWIHLLVEYDIGEPTPCFAKLEVYHQPEGQEPARFTGKFREELVDGSLWVYAQVEVTRPGAYVLDANFFAADDAPVAFARAKTDLGAGVVEVGFQLFGRIVHEQDARAPFKLRQLRGYRFLAGADPDRELMADFPGEHVTRAYDRTDFSDAEFWDDSKQRQVDFHIQQAASSSHAFYQRTLGQARDQGWSPRP